MRHRTTDPACAYHRPPTGWLSRWRFNRSRGRFCQRCDAMRRLVKTLPAGPEAERIAALVREHG